MTDQPSRKLDAYMPMDSWVLIGNYFQNFEDFDVHFVESLGQFEGGLPQDWESPLTKSFQQMNSHQPSVGGTFIGSRSLLYAAAQRPEAFTDIILLDPPFSWSKRASCGY